MSLLVLFAVLETLRPRRQLQYSKSRRWINNFGISFLNTLVAGVLLPVAGVAAAVLATEKDWGLFNTQNVSSWIGIAIYLLVFDRTIYLQHRRMLSAITLFGFFDGAYFGGNR